MPSTQGELFVQFNQLSEALAIAIMSSSGTRMGVSPFLVVPLQHRETYSPTYGRSRVSPRTGTRRGLTSHGRTVLFSPFLNSELNGNFSMCPCINRLSGSKG